MPKVVHAQQLHTPDRENTIAPGHRQNHWACYLYMQHYKRKLLKRGGVVAAGILLLLAAGGLAGYWLRPTGPSHAPDIELATLSGERISLQQLRGRPLLVNFWATSCAQCLHELPKLIELYRHAPAQKLEIIAIAMPYDRPDHVLSVSEAKQLPYPVALDIEGLAARSFGGVKLTPTFFLIAPDGRIVHRSTGELDLEKIQSMLDDMIPYTGEAFAARQAG